MHRSRRRPCTTSAAAHARSSSCSCRAARSSARALSSRCRCMEMARCWFSMTRGLFRWRVVGTKRWRGGGFRRRLVAVASARCSERGAERGCASDCAAIVSDGVIAASSARYRGARSMVRRVPRIGVGGSLAALLSHAVEPFFNALRALTSQASHTFDRARDKRMAARRCPGAAARPRSRRRRRSARARRSSR